MSDAELELFNDPEYTKQVVEWMDAPMGPYRVDDIEQQLQETQTKLADAEALLREAAGLLDTVYWSGVCDSPEGEDVEAFLSRPEIKAALKERQAAE